MRTLFCSKNSQLVDLLRNPERVILEKINLAFASAHFLTREGFYKKENIKDTYLSRRVPDGCGC